MIVIVLESLFMETLNAALQKASQEVMVTIKIFIILLSFTIHINCVFEYEQTD